MSAPHQTAPRGLIAIDKVGGVVLFLDPVSYETVKVLDGFVPRLHELAISPDRKLAYVPIYGDGIHGNNPHPGHLIAIIDLDRQEHVGDIDASPLLAPHASEFGADGLLYTVCENNGVVAVIDAKARKVLATIPVRSTNSHRIALAPGATRLYTENEEDPTASVLDLATRTRVGEIAMPDGSAGLAVSPDGGTLLLVDAKRPELVVVDAATNAITRRVRLAGHEKPAQIARWSPDGRHVVVTSYEAPLGTLLDPALERQRLLHLGRGPMNMGFHPDGHTVLIGNHDEGTLAVVDLDEARVLRTVPAGTGVETLSFF